MRVEIILKTVTEHFLHKTVYKPHSTFLIDVMLLV